MWHGRAHVALGEGQGACASKSTVALYVVLSVLAAITVFALVVMDYGKVSFPAAMAAAVEDFVTMMTQPGLGGHFTLPD